MKSATKNQRGVFTVFVAILIPIAVGMFGLGIDISHYVWVGGQLQNAADAAAFAGARELNGSSAGRVNATRVASLYAQQNSVDGRHVAAEEVIENVVGRWDPATSSFSSEGVSDAAANALRVRVWREDVPAFFARLLSETIATQSLSRSAIAVAGGPGAAECTAPFTIASCAIKYDADDEMICPSALSFQSGSGSIGLTLPDGDGPVSGSRAAPYIEEVMSNPSGCAYPTSVGDRLEMQNGNDLQKGSIDAINAATASGASPIPITLAVLDVDCGSGGPTYNGSAEVSGYIKMNIVGARGTEEAPEQVEAACPGIGKKNICVTGNCSKITGVGAGGTSQVVAADSHLVE